MHHQWTSKVRALITAIVALCCFTVKASTSSMTEDLHTLQVLAAKLAEYRAKNGYLPSGSNKEVIAALAQVDYRPTRLSNAGELLDVKGKPVVIICTKEGWAVVGTLNEALRRFEEYVLIPPRNVKYPPEP